VPLTFTSIVERVLPVPRRRRDARRVNDVVHVLVERHTLDDVLLEQGHVVAILQVLESPGESGRQVVDRDHPAGLVEQAVVCEGQGVDQVAWQEAGSAGHDHGLALQPAHRFGCPAENLVKVVRNAGGQLRGSHPSRA
jgi:hypothetical protein